MFILYINCLSKKFCHCGARAAAAPGWNHLQSSVLRLWLWLWLWQHAQVPSGAVILNYNLADFLVVAKNNPFLSLLNTQTRFKNPNLCSFTHIYRSFKRFHSGGRHSTPQCAIIFYTATRTQKWSWLLGQAAMCVWINFDPDLNREPCSSMHPQFNSFFLGNCSWAVGSVAVVIRQM